MSFFVSSLCKSFCVSSSYYYYYYISVSDSVFHVILLLLYHLHFDYNCQNQEITGKPPQIDLYQRKKQDDVCFDKMSKVSIVLFQTIQNNNEYDIITF